MDLPWVKPPPADRRPPGLVGVRFAGPGTVEWSFDEPVEEVRLTGEQLAAGSVFVLEDRVRWLTNKSLEPGELLAWGIEVGDAAGNNHSLAGSVPVPNPVPAGLVLREVAPAGDARHPDFVELEVTRDGNLAGESLVYGVPGRGGWVLEFPPRRVKAGQLLLVRGGGGAVPETGALILPKGLAVSGGVLAVVQAPDGPVLDCLVWSAGGAGRYQGWSSKALAERAVWAAKEGGWIFGSGGSRPEGAADSRRVTATSSLVRKHPVRPGEGRSAADWKWSGAGLGSPGKK